MLLEPDRRLIEERFNIPVISTYEAIEALKIGFECERRTGFHLHVDLCVLRIVDGNGNPLSCGEQGEIVISNLINKATVLLNYKLGDIGVMSEKPCDCGRSLPILSELKGRSNDVIKLRDGSFVHPAAVGMLFKNRDNVLQYQVIQEQISTFVVKVVTIEVTDQIKLKHELVRDFKGYLGEDTSIEVEFPRFIPRTKSGKSQKVISIALASFG